MDNRNFKLSEPKHSRPGSRGGSLADEFRMLRYVWSAARGYHLRIILTTILQILLGLLPAGITYAVQEAVTGGPAAVSLLTAGNLTGLLGAILGLSVIKQLSGVIQGFAMADVRRNIEREYINRLRQEGTAAGGNRSVMAFARESEMLTGLIPMVYRSFIQAPITVVSFFVLMVWLSLQLASVIFVIVGVVVGCSVMLRTRIKAARRALYGRLADLYQVFADWLRGYRVVRFYDSGEFLSGRLDDVVNDSCRLNKKLVGLSAWQNIAVEILTYCGVLAFIYVVVNGERTDEWNILLTYPLAILFIRSETVKIILGYAQLTATESSVRNIPYDAPEKPGNKPATAQPDNEKSITGSYPAESLLTISLENIVFSYDEGEQPLLDNVSATFTRGKLNVIAGESGKGKSTLLDIISLAIEPRNGCVLFNGLPAAYYGQQALFTRMSMVEQEPFMFEGTFLENLTFGQEHDAQEILQLCRRLKLTHLITSVEDLSRQVSDAGHNLSVGEKQRLAFIRAMLKKPDVILLDEATSSVDTETAVIMMEYIREISASTLILCVSHDSRVIDMADNLFLLEDRKLIIHRCKPINT